jgi:hypothetical protein
VSDADFAIARRIYALSTSFYFYMSYMILASIDAILAFVLVFVPGDILNQRLPSVRFFHITIALTVGSLIHSVNAVLSLTVLALSPIVLVSVTRTWSSLSGWRRSFLRFAIMSNIESVAFEAEDPRDRLFDAMIAANPDYERILSKTTKLLQGTGIDDATTTIKEMPLDIFKNITIGHRRSAATFDVVIGFPPNKMRKTSLGVGANEILKSRTIGDALRDLASIGISAGRVAEGKPSTRSYMEFAEDLKLLSSYADSPVMRGFLVYKEKPPPELLFFANDKNNWPRFQLERIPIVVLVQEENGYEVMVLAS